MNGWRIRLLVVLMLAAAVFAAWSFYVAHSTVQARVHDQAALNAERAQRAAKDRMILCHATNRANGALRVVLRLAKAGVSAPFDRQLTDRQRDSYARAYGRALLLTRPVDCSRLR